MAFCGCVCFNVSMISNKYCMMGSRTPRWKCWCCVTLQRVLKAGQQSRAELMDRVE